jgi:Putative Flp pilus-assembly TadE/G-like
MHGAWRRRRVGDERGQIIVIFGASMIAFLVLAACVIDLSWYWTNNLRMQRAADAAALAGVVFLPGDVPGAFAAARAEAVKNGYTNGAGGYTVTPSHSTADPRRLRVTITGPVNTYFAKVAGIASFPARREAKADFVLPVPMGSPQNYYGVGFYEGRVATTTNNSGNTDWNATSVSSSGGQWSSPNNAFTNDNIYATEDTNNELQAWTNFADLRAEVPNDGTQVIDGIQVRLQDARLTGSGSSSDCRLGVGLSWNSGGSWTNYVASDVLTDSDTDPVVGSASDLSMWVGHTSWTRDELANGTFRVRLRWQDGTGNCASTRNVRLDQLEVRVTYHTVSTTWANQELTVYDPSDGSALDSQGFWGAMFTSGGNRENGDRFGPANLGNGAGGSAGDPNPNYDANGYDYTLELPGGSGQVQLFDPMFCATGNNGHGGSYGAGDHWTDHPGGQVIAPVGITYRLYDTQGTVANTSDDGAPIATLTYDPGSATMGDFSGAFGTPQNNTDPNRQDCSTNPGHHQWVLPSGFSGLASGIYRLNVNTTLDGDNINVGAENLFSIWVKSGGNARVFGGGRMAAYTNLAGGLQQFYFAQIEKVHAGKTMEIQLFDPGEASGNAYLRILSPDGDSYDYVTFDYTSTNGRSGTGVTQIQTSVSGAAQFNNHLVTITVPLPPSYGSMGLDPPGDVTDEEGWWKIEYNVNQGNDTTTWQVSIRGNPVHLVLP